MKFVRYGAVNEERPGILDADGRIRSLYPLVKDFTADLVTPECLSLLRAIDPRKLPLVEGKPRLGMPVGNVRQVIAIGLNYLEHVREAEDIPVPEYPAVFAKSIHSLSGPSDPITFPESATKVDWEVELAFFIGKRARRVSVEDALQHVAGFCTAADVSERELQLGPGGQMGHGKSLDTFTPIGPWFVTADEVADPQKLNLWLDVNGQRFQNGNTSQMIFNVATIVSHLSRYQTLLPGDMFMTGTPKGIGYAQKPQKFLRPGDRVVLSVEGMGVQDHMVAHSS